MKFLPPLIVECPNTYSIRPAIQASDTMDLSVIFRAVILTYCLLPSTISFTKVLSIEHVFSSEGQALAILLSSTAVIELVREFDIKLFRDVSHNFNHCLYELLPTNKIQL